MEMNRIINFGTIPDSTSVHQVIEIIINKSNILINFK